MLSSLVSSRSLTHAQPPRHTLLGIYVAAIAVGLAGVILFAWAS